MKSSVTTCWSLNLLKSVIEKLEYLVPELVEGKKKSAPLSPPSSLSEAAAVEEMFA